MSIKLKIEGEIFEVDPRYAEVSGLIEVLVKQSAGEEVFNILIIGIWIIKSNSD